MTDPNSSIVLSQFTASGVMVMLMELGKKAPWLPITKDSDVLNRWVAAIGSLLIAIGIHGAYHFDSVERVLSLQFSIPTASGLFWGACHWGRSMLMQEGEYRSYKVFSALPKVLTLLEKLQAQNPTKP